MIYGQLQGCFAALSMTGFQISYQLEAFPLDKAAGFSWFPGAHQETGMSDCSEDTLERGHPARRSRRTCTCTAGRTPALQSFHGFREPHQETGMSDRFENALSS